MSRLTKLRTRNGSKGFTELIKGHRIPKSDSLCFFNNEIQKTIVLIQLWIKKYSLLDTTDLELLSKLANPELGKLTASLWAKLEMQQLAPSPELLQLFETRLSEINKQFKSADEFLVFNSTPALEFYEIALYLRNIEHYVWTVIHRFYSFDISNFTEEAVITGDFYNLLGDYAFTLCRFIEKKVSAKEEYWQNPLLTPQTELIVSDDVITQSSATIETLSEQQTNEQYW